MKLIWLNLSHRQIMRAVWTVLERFEETIRVFFPFIFLNGCPFYSFHSFYLFLLLLLM